MSIILSKAWEGYNFMFNELPDPRTKPWLLAAKPYQILTVLGLYLIFVLKWGPKYMKKRPAYNLDKLLIVYNILQIISCIYILYNALVLAWGWHYKWACEPVDFSTTERAINIAKFTYFYYIMKVVDLLDTVFFILRKKYHQVSFLHIYHHTGMVLLTWAASTYLPGGHGTLVGVINTFVHIIMYSYYLYTVANPSAKQSLWWKKYITQIQILQFFLCVVHMLSPVFKQDCAYPRWVSFVFIPQNCFILILFLDFYIKNYIRKPQAQQIADMQKSKLTNGFGISSNGNTNTVDNEMETLKFAINNKDDETHDENGIRKNETLSNGQHRLQNGTNGSRNVTHRSNGSMHHNVSHSENGPRTRNYKSCQKTCT